MNLVKTALIGAGVALLAGASVAQDTSTTRTQPAPESAVAATEEADPIVCRSEVVRTNSRLQRRGDRRCLRRSEWETQRRLAEERAVDVQRQQGGRGAGG
ncbi:MAG TPA: hypothetical protein VLZ73_01280 [Brevundimonas sp.]|nr:hypothetical protein [Brevundimonas sp.]